MRWPRGLAFRVMAIGLFLAVSVSFLNFSSAFEQHSYPSRTVRIVLGFGPGTSPDIALRFFAERLSHKWAKPVIVENVVGAAGNIAGERVARAEPDAHTLLLAASSGIVISPALHASLPYDPVKDLKPISLIYQHPNLLAVHNSVSANNVQGVVEAARSRPGRLNIASAGAGTTQHLAAELFRTLTGADLVHVPYRGGNSMMTDLIAGRVDMLFGIPTSILPLAREGHIRALAVTSPRRFPGAPELPTMAESGFPGFDITVWWGLFAPSRTPARLIGKLHEASAEVLADPEVRKRFEEMGVEVVGNSPSEFSAVITAEIPKWERIVRDAGIRLE